jgi:hypothetical protein
MASTDARPIPIRATAYRVTFPILDADGDLVAGATGLNTASTGSAISKDGATFADVTNTVTQIATSSGMYFLDLTSTEMTADCVVVLIRTTTSGAKTTPIVLYPQDVGDIKVDSQSLLGTTITTPTTAGLFDVNLLQINADATGAANLARTTRAIGRGTVSGSPSTTSIPTSAFTPAGAALNQFVGRIITFDATTTTTALRGQATDITASSNAATPTFTVTALSTAPAVGDTFSVT